ncbi:lysostaphin resistance A-like protein [Anaerobacillus isosaccharinicus]|uniref:CAAX protease family protein n=1 Tax=Anaerobacillus isosaccharinicus TaxID=1532552 RepID=A0A1S2MDX2_9BACI|nr:type II CAAX endopeptidase family protein [Anaerobacillus isosaccharinicus]MBA5588790.1 CPBP family intramembrane metalloprotease [Anaerobacillus isosaccharinicus]QOY37815.1 CPBP family intramembrane metalloprotease [Anaerobacillus isosaccharinicus]
MTKRYWLVILTYILMQLSAIIGVPLLMLMGIEREQIPGIWTLFSFSIGFIIILLFLRQDMSDRHLNRDRSSKSEAIVWSIAGIFMAFMAQYFAVLIEISVFGIEPGSENTEMIVELAKATPALILVVAVIGPILEEIIFRMIIFGSLYKRFNFWIAAIISSVIFAAVHMDFEHILVYTFMGVVFAFLYVKTKRIIVPIIAHVALNSFVMLVQVIFGDRLLELQRKLEEMQGFIGGLF